MVYTSTYKMKIPKSYRNPEVIFKNSNTHGKGMFASKTIKKDTIILIWGGDWNIDYTNSKGLKKAIADEKHIIKWDKNLYSIEYDGEDPNYYINHSCNPNSWLIDNFTLVARRNIKRGEEITADYSTWETGSYVSKWKCRCNSKKCREIITGNDWKRKTFQKKYRGHTTGLVARLIKDND